MASQQQQQRRASTMALTFPILTWKEITDLLNQALGMNISQNEVSSPTPATVTRVYSAMLDLVSGVPRPEVMEIVQRALQSLDTPEIYREALTQLTLLREMEVICNASLWPDFRLDDLVNPTGSRFLKILSAILNFGRFREDVFRQHAEQTEGIAKLEKELSTLKECEEGLKESIRHVNERLAEEEPERRRILSDMEREESLFNGLFKENESLQKSLYDLKKQEQELKAKHDLLVLDISKTQNEIADIRSQLVSSPERIQAGLQQLKKRLEQEREEIENLREQERKSAARVEDLTSANDAMDDLLQRIANVEEKAEESQKEEEKTRSRKATIENHSYKVIELRQREQEALREVKFAEERNNRLVSQKTTQVKHARDVLKSIKREVEDRERHASEDIRKASRLRAEITALKAQLDRSRLEYEAIQASRTSEFGNVVAAFDAYVESLLSGISIMEDACLTPSSVPI